MVPHLFRTTLSAIGKTDPFKPAGPGTVVTGQAHVAGTGSVSASAKLQGTNTPSIESSWIDLDTLTPSGTTAAVDSGTVTTAFTAFRFDCTAISGTGAVLTVSIGRG